MLGTGAMASHHAERIRRDPGCEIVAARRRRSPSARRDFAAAHSIAQRLRLLDEAIAWGEFDAAINATPDGVHKATTLALLAAGKHGLLREAAGAEPSPTPWR